jgi:hypothetical protein
MTLNKTKGFAVSLVSLGLLAAGMSAPIANATTVTSTVDAIDNCVWQLGSVPTSWSLTNTNDYIGDALTLTSEDADYVVLGLAGSTEAANAVSIGSLSSSECSFYNSIISGGVTAKLEGAAVFNATYGSGTEDSEMDIVLANSPLTMSGSSMPECNATYFASTLADTDFATLNQTATIMSSKSLTNIMAGGQGTSGTLASYKTTCQQSLDLSIRIPGRSTVPAGNGQNYTFTGPTFLFAKTTS